jgi:hypothetical protein
MTWVLKNGAEVIEQPVHGRYVCWLLRNDHEVIKVHVSVLQGVSWRGGFVGAYGGRGWW